MTRGDGAGPARRFLRALTRPGLAGWLLALLGVAGIAWTELLLRQAGRADLSPVRGSDAAPLVLAALSAATVGAVLASRRPRHPVGWLLLAMGLILSLSGMATGYAAYGLLARPGALPGAGYAAALHNVSAVLLGGCLAGILLLTPTGAPPSPRWRWWLWVCVAAPVVGVMTSAVLPFEEPFESVANPLRLAGADAVLAPLSAAAWAATGLAVPVAAVSLLVRFRRARGVERQQLRWLALAAALVGLLILTAGAGVATFAALSEPGGEVLLGWLTAVAVALLPLATGAAILRYRLYDLDRIVSRTVTYGVLTVLLGGAYAAVVLALGQRARQDSPLAVAAATLAVASLAGPVRRRVQDLVDRRFNRRGYDAARTVRRFSLRLREELDLDALSDDLVSVVDQTVQPTHVRLWLPPVPVAGRGRDGGHRR